jgi:hypothetical protein
LKEHEDDPYLKKKLKTDAEGGQEEEMKNEAGDKDELTKNSDAYLRVTKSV